MRSRNLRVLLGLLAAVWALGSAMETRAQGPGVNVRPVAGPFDPSQVLSEAPPAEGVAIRAGRLFDPKSGTNLANQVIVIKGDRITDVGPADKVQIPQGARVIDLSSATVLPGLIDRHVHLFQDQQPNDARAAFIGLNYALRICTRASPRCRTWARPSPTPPSNCATPSTRAWWPGRACRWPGRRSIREAATYYPAPSIACALRSWSGRPGLAAHQ